MSRRGGSPDCVGCRLAATPRPWWKPGNPCIGCGGPAEDRTMTRFDGYRQVARSCERCDLFWFERVHPNRAAA